MRRVLVLTMAMAMAVMLAMAAPAGASPPSGIEIEVETSLLGAPSPFVVFSDDGGLLCDEGTVHDDSGKATGFSPNGFNFQGVKHFTCDDGSGEFFINLKARIDFRKGVTFSWNVLRGTGDYENLHGAGTGVGLDLCGPDCVFDVYNGGMHIDP